MNSHVFVIGEKIEEAPEGSNNEDTAKEVKEDVFLTEANDEEAAAENSPAEENHDHTEQANDDTLDLAKDEFDPEDNSDEGQREQVEQGDEPPVQENGVSEEEGQGDHITDNQEKEGDEGEEETTDKRSVDGDDPDSGAQLGGETTLITVDANGSGDSWEGRITFQL